MNTVESPTKLHPVTVATVWHSMQTICHEMRHVIDRTAQCFLIALLHDISVGIWDGQGRHTIAIPTGLPVQFMGGKYTMRYILEQFGDEIYPGDVFLTNDPYHGASCHLPDWAFIRPIFFEDEMVFFTMARAHQYDTGGSFPGGYFPNAYDIHAEGICIPPVKVFERGVERKDIFQLVWNNTRWPEGVRVDNYAMIAATKVCEKRLVGLMKKYGKEVVKECVDEMLRRTEKAVRAEVTKIPDGTYSSESSTDDDGTELDVPVTVRLDLTVRGEEMILDFSRSDGQRRGFVNSIYASTYSNAMAATLIFFDPELADFHNEGSMAPISIIAPEGSVLNARYPATVGASPVAMGTHTMEAVLLALSKAMPNHAVAPWARHYSHYIFGVDPRTGVQYVQTTFDSDGGAGAMSGYDGFEGAATLATLAEVNRSNTEEVEIRVPWRMLHYEFATDTAGVGKWRGASGVRWEMINEGGDSGMATGSADGEHPGCNPSGVQGGGDGPLNQCHIIHNGEKRVALGHRMHSLKKGDIVAKLAGGGAGVGNPAERDPEKVREDVLNEFFSTEKARDVFKVVFKPGTLQIDREATQALRKKA